MHNVGLRIAFGKKIRFPHVNFGEDTTRMGDWKSFEKGRTVALEERFLIKVAVW